MICLNCENVDFSYGAEKVLSNVTLRLQDTDKAALVGVNGAGKSTLFKLIYGVLKPDSGNINIPKNYRLGYLEQNSGLNSENSIWDEIITAFSDLIQMEKELKKIELRMNLENADFNDDRLINKYYQLSEEFAALGGYEYKSRAKGVLKGLGFTEQQFTSSVDTLSGGQKTSLAMAKLLLIQPDILLLDEPTNHLDIDSIEWLENYLSGYKKCVFIISHDRYFLDKVVNKVIDLEYGKCTIYDGNYSKYIKQKQVNKQIQQSKYENQQRVIKKMEAFIKQQKQWNRERNIKAAESRQKAIDRMAKIEKPKNSLNKINVKFRSSIISGKDVLFVEHLTKEFPGKLLFEDVNFKLQKNEKVFLLGPNGCGKSTLLKILSGNLEQTSGVFEYGHNVTIGYYDQELKDLNCENTVLEEVWDSNSQLKQSDIRTTLASFNFTEDDVFKKISVLSGGEKSRVLLAKLMLSGCNFLILDEPTNHLDISSREVLEDALAKYDGTLLCVSHDRYFVSKLADRIIEMNKSSILDIKGSYEFFQQYKEENIKENNLSNKTISEGKLNYLVQKQEQAKQRKQKKRLNQTEKKIIDLEEKLEHISSDLMDESIASDHIKLSELVNCKNKLEAELEKLYMEWEELTDKA